MRFLRRLPNRVSFRQTLAVVALVAHVLAATGAPLPSSSRLHGNSSVAYPCQQHLCGCQTSEQGWAGDCCCFTLEQKLAWAEARGVEPPSHVRPAVEAKKARQALAKPKRTCCQSEPEPAAEPSCCEREAACEKNAVDESASIRWVGGIFTQKCRGEGPAGLLKLEPTAPPPLTSEHSATPEPEGFVRVASIPAVITSQSPPIRPPRLV